MRHSKSRFAPALSIPIASHVPAPCTSYDDLRCAYILCASLPPCPVTIGLLWLKSLAPDSYASILSLERRRWFFSCRVLVHDETSFPRDCNQTWPTPILAYRQKAELHQPRVLVGYAS